MQGQRGLCFGFLNPGAPPLESPGVRRRTEGRYSLLYVALQRVAYGAGARKALVGSGSRAGPPPVEVSTDASARDPEKRDPVLGTDRAPKTWSGDDPALST